MTQPKPWLSVIMPVYNGRQFLVTALESVLQQSDRQIEVIVSDDGSTDGSTEIIDAYAARNAIIPLAGPACGNWAANSNMAVSRCGGQFITFLHQDDLWLPGRLASIRSSIESHPACSLWISPTRYLDAAGRIVGTWRLPFTKSRLFVEAQEFLERLLVQNFIGMPAPVFTRHAFDSAGGLDEALWFAADWDLWLKLGSRNGVGVSPDATTAFRIHPGSQTIMGAAAHDSMSAQIEIVRKRYLSLVVDGFARDSVDRAGRFSCDLNDCLASLVAGQPVRWRRLLSSFVALRGGGLYRYLRDARILERSVARIMVGLGSVNP